MTATTELQASPLDPFAGMMNEDAARAILGLRASPEVQARVDIMADKSREGQLTEDEQRQYEAYADTVSMISLLQAHARRVLRQAGKL